MFAHPLRARSRLRRRGFCRLTALVLIGGLAAAAIVPWVLLARERAARAAARPSCRYVGTVWSVPSDRVIVYREIGGEDLGQPAVLVPQMGPAQIVEFYYPPNQQPVPPRLVIVGDR